jgi:oxygen-independent coproporphyrinogen-3 oxidase
VKPKCLEEATKYFDNISLDLIYGVPGMSNEKKQNIEKALSFCTTHLELCFDGRAQTAMNKMIQTGKMEAPKRRRGSGMIL